MDPFDHSDGVAFVRGFGWVSAAERFAADRFFDDLIGAPKRGARPAAARPAAARPAAARPAAIAPEESERPRLRLVPGPVEERRGFIGVGGVVRSEEELRDAVVAAALAERDAWLDRGRLRHESDPAIFGRLVRCYLATIRDARPDTLVAILRAAERRTDYGRLLEPTVLVATLGAEARRVRNALLSSVPGASVPEDLGARIEAALLHARQAHLGTGSWSAWSSVFVSMLVRSVAIDLGLEREGGGEHHGRDKLLRPAAAHRVYVLEAYERRRRGEVGAYQAFDPNRRAPQLGDIIVQDRQARTMASALTYGRIPELASPRQTHGDVVIAIDDDSVITIGGNVDDSVRRRRFPLHTDGRLVVDPSWLYAQENARGHLPDVPAPSSASLHERSMGRIFALLSPVSERAHATAGPDPR